MEKLFEEFTLMQYDYACEMLVEKGSVLINIICLRNHLKFACDSSVKTNGLRKL